MKIKIICIGKLKEKYLKDGVEEYVKRIKRFANVEIIELGDERIPDNASDAECEKIKIVEGEKILAKINNNEYIISLCVEGTIISSEQLAQKMSTVMVGGCNCITFIIGGSLGLSDKVKNASHFKLSFSKMTFPHQLMRMVLCEQVYRSFKINANESYHK